MHVLERRGLRREGAAGSTEQRDGETEQGERANDAHGETELEFGDGRAVKFRGNSSSQKATK